MTDFQWMPWLFWIATGLALLPAGLAIYQSHRRILILLVLISQIGIFLLLVSLAAILAAFIYLILSVLVNILALYIINSFPDEEAGSLIQTSVSPVLNGVLSILLLAGLITALHPNNILIISSASLHLQPFIPDISLLLILVGLLVLLIFIALSRFFKRI